MNREIKFRAWHPLNKEMVYPRTGQNFGYGGYTRSDILKDFDDEFIMQYTGLLDKNKNEIYEGDIVKKEETITNGYIAEVFWADVRCSFAVRYKDRGIFCYADLIKTNKNGNVDRTSDRDYYHEIIGNVFQNPELISKP